MTGAHGLAGLHSAWHRHAPQSLQSVKAGKQMQASPTLPSSRETRRKWKNESGFWKEREAQGTVT